MALKGPNQMSAHQKIPTHLSFCNLLKMLVVIIKEHLKLLSAKVSVTTTNNNQQIPIHHFKHNNRVQLV